MQSVTTAVTKVVEFTTASISKPTTFKTAINRKFFQSWKITKPLLPVLQVFVGDHLVPDFYPRQHRSCRITLTGNTKGLANPRGVVH